MSGIDINEVTKMLEDHERRISLLEGRPDKTERASKKMSIKEFVLKKNPVDDMQRTLLIGYYLEHFGGMDRFNVKDLSEGFRLAKEPLPTNINDKVNKNIEKARIMEAGEKKDKLKAWILTNSGEKYVDNGLQEKK